MGSFIQGLNDLPVDSYTCESSQQFKKILYKNVQILRLTIAKIDDVIFLSRFSEVRSIIFEQCECPSNCFGPYEILLILTTPNFFDADLENAIIRS